MNLVDPPDLSVEPGVRDEGGWPLAVALAVIGPLAVVLAVAMIAIALD